MSIILPKYQLSVPSETTRFRDLGKELREFGISINDTLESFDYNGADPDLVLSRVAALETWKNDIAPRVAALEDVSKERAWTIRSTSAFSIGTSYVDLSTSANWETPTLKGGVTWDNGFVVPRAGRYLVNMSICGRGAGDLLFGFSKVVAPTYYDLLGGQNGRAVQSLSFVSAASEMNLEAGDRVKAYTLASSGTVELRTNIGAFSIRRVE